MTNGIRNRSARGAKRFWIGLWMWALCVVPCPLFAADRAESLLEPGDTSSPQATLKTFLSACEDLYAMVKSGESVSGSSALLIRDRVLRCLDLREIADYRREAAGKEAAVALKEVLDRIELPNLERAESPPPDRWRIPHTEIAIVRIEEGKRAGEYLFSAETVDRATEFYDRVKHLPYRPDATEGIYDWYLSHPRLEVVALAVRHMPGWMLSRYAGQAVWQWFGLVIVVISAVGLLLFLYRFGRARAVSTRFSNMLRYWGTLGFPAAAMGIPLAAKWFIEEGLAVSGATLAIVAFAADMVFLVTAIVLVLAIQQRITDYAIASPSIHPQGLDAQFIRLVGRVLGILLAVVLFLEGGRHFGIPLATLLAGAGVGGLAVALAAQDALKNLFGSLMIILDKPYQIGDRIVVKGYDGVVEEIGLRSTKLRLLTGHWVTLPNEEMARMDIENVARRRHIRRVSSIGLALETTPEQAQQALEIVRDLLKDHPGRQEDFPPRVFLDDFNRDSLNLRFFYWFHPPDYWEYLAFSERLNLDITRRFQEAGIKIARPSVTNYLVQEEDAIPPDAEVESDIVD